MNNTFNNIRYYLKEVQKIDRLSSKEVQLLSHPQRVKKTILRVQGKAYPAWRVLFNDALGPGKGGIRFHPQANQDEVTSLSFWMTIKNALVEIPYGGAKGAVKFNPKKTSLKTQEIISRKFIDFFYPVLGQDKDIPAPDVYTNSQTMAWMLDEYEKKTGHHEPAMITGKPLILGGLKLRADATAKGGFFIIQEIIKTYRLPKSHLKIAMQGFGNAGANLAQMLNQNHFKIVAVSDSQGGIYDKNGLDIVAVGKTKKEKGSVVNYSKGQPISNQKILELPVDILILAALENQITEKNVGKINASYIVEVANGPVTYSAEKQLFSKNITVVPDVLVNSGGVIVSYFEWCQNKTGNILAEDYLAKLLKEKMINNWIRVLSLQKEHHQKISLKTAAYLLAIRRILTAEKLRGKI
jgi:glutamate dehydrogenase/leucine dehydrogenase